MLTLEDGASSPPRMRAAKARNSLHIDIEILKCCRDEFVSRGFISKEIGAQRALVDKHVATLLEDGLLVEHIQERGGQRIPAKHYRVSALWRSGGQA